MKILNKEEASKTIYYDFEAELKDGSIIYGTLIAYWDNNNLFRNYELKINKEDSDKLLTKKELKELKILVINY